MKLRRTRKNGNLWNIRLVLVNNIHLVDDRVRGSFLPVGETFGVGFFPGWAWFAVVVAGRIGICHTYSHGYADVGIRCHL